MVNFGRSALRYQYLWPHNKKGKTPVLYLQDDCIERSNGYHVLSFINRFMSTHGLTNLESFQKLEWMICKYLPEELTLRCDIEEWLRKNWAKKVYFD